MAFSIDRRMGEEPEQADAVIDRDDNHAALLDDSRGIIKAATTGHQRVLRFRMAYLGPGDKERALDGLDQAYEAVLAMAHLAEGRSDVRPASFRAALHHAPLKTVRLGSASKP